MWKLRRWPICDSHQYGVTAAKEAPTKALGMHGPRMERTPSVIKACRLKDLIRQAFFNCHSRATASRPSPSGGLRPALTRSRGKPESSNSTPSSLSSSTQNDEGPRWACRRLHHAPRTARSMHRSRPLQQSNWRPVAISISDGACSDFTKLRHI